MYSHFNHTGSITMFGIVFVAALVSCWLLARRNASVAGIHPSHIDLLLPLAIVAGIAGAWGLSLLMPGDRLLAGEAMQVDVRPRLFGIVLFGALVTIVYSRLNKLQVWSMLDVLALPTLTALVVHRFGCFVAGCCWGDISVAQPELDVLAGPALAMQVQTVAWLSGEWIATGVTYDPGSLAYTQHLALGLIAADMPKSLPVHPVQLYELVLVAATILYLGRKAATSRPPGLLALRAAAAYAVIRFFLEFLRADGALVVGTLTMPQLQCAALAVVAVFASRHGMMRGHAARHQHP